MALIILMVLIFSGGLMTESLVLLPIRGLEWLHVPTWLSLSAIALAFFWYFGE